jgi:hypothetical protein
MARRRAQVSEKEVPFIFKYVRRALKRWLRAAQRNARRIDAGDTDGCVAVRFSTLLPLGVLIACAAERARPGSRTDGTHGG